MKQHEKVISNVRTLLADLKSCSKRRDLRKGRRIHAEVVENRKESNLYVATALIEMYSRCGSMVDARRVFDSVQNPNVVCWTALLMGFSENGEGLAALESFSRMKTYGCSPDSVAYTAALKACISLAVNGNGSRNGDALERGKKIHFEIGCHMDKYLQNMLIVMYCKCGSMVDARRLFNSMEDPDVVAWTALLQGYAENGEELTALELFTRMKSHGCAPNSVTYIAALKACSNMTVNGGKEHCLEWGRQIHSEIGGQLNEYMQNTLIYMYGKCGSIVDAHRVFDNIQKPGVVSWNALLLGYTENGEGLAALELFSKMKVLGLAPNSVTYIAALKSCTSLAVRGDDNTKKDSLERGRRIHSEIGCHSNRRVNNMLIHMYSDCGCMTDARHVFDSLQKPDVVSWTALLMGYAENGEGPAGLTLFTRMKASGYTPDSVTYVAALKACISMAISGGKAGALERGKEIHMEIGCYIQSTLIEMYSKCGNMVEAHRVFDSVQNPSVVSWTSLLVGYSENGEGLAALELFSRMKACGCYPNSITYVAALKSCTSLAVNGDEIGKRTSLERGRQIHLEIGYLDHHVLSTLIEMYAKCGSLVEARQVFDSISNPDVVSWNALILGYVVFGKGRSALELFSSMKFAGQCVPNCVTYAAVFKACASLAVNGDDSGRTNGLERGKKIHSEIGCHLDHQLKSTIIDMYSKCGSMVEARLVFDSIHKPDVVSWTALILGYVENGEGYAALDLFSRMKAAHCVPNSVTYVAALKACSLIGTLALGQKIHSEITEFSAHVVTCLVSFYAKSGRMLEACEVFDFHSRERVVSTWNALMAGYGSFGDICSVFKLFEAMQDEGFQPDAVTFGCILSCCSHAGLVGKARQYFEAMAMQYGVTPTSMHFTCMVDVLGRANQLQEAIFVLQNMPHKPSAVTWMTLLGACCKWKNVEIGRWAFGSLLNMNRKIAPAYVLMAHIHGKTGCLEIN